MRAEVDELESGAANALRCDIRHEDLTAMRSVDESRASNDGRPEHVTCSLERLTEMDGHPDLESESIWRLRPERTLRLGRSTHGVPTG